MAKLEMMLKATLKQKRVIGLKKTEDTLQESSNAIAVEIASVESDLVQNHQEVTMLCNDKYNELCSKMEDIINHIQNDTDAYQIRMNDLWDNYRTIYNKVEPLSKDLAQLVQQKKAIGQKRLSELQKLVAEKLSTAEKKIDKIKKRCSKLPELAKILSAFL